MELNGQPYIKGKHDKKLALRKLIQYAKFRSCSRDTPLPDEVKWVKLNVSGRNLRVTPKKLLKPQDFEALVKVADNSKDETLLHVLFGQPSGQAKS